MIEIKRKSWLKTVFLLFFAILILIFFQNGDIMITSIEYKNKEVPDDFDGFKIMQISDLHNKMFGNGQSELIKLTKQAAPDMIAITGDLIDSYHTNIEAAMIYVKEAVKIATVYYVAGNHEHRLDNYLEFTESLRNAGVIVLDNNKCKIVRGEDSISVVGLQDPDFCGPRLFAAKLRELTENNSGFSLLLSHRPEKIDLYSECGVNLVMAGHAHGGQIRLPFIGAIFAPGQGFPPKYTSGLYEVGRTSMVVSRGLGNSFFPFRIFNRPEIIVLTLRTG